MLEGLHLSIIKYIANSTEVFPRTDIKGGVVISLYNKDFFHIRLVMIHLQLNDVK